MNGMKRYILNNRIKLWIEWIFEAADWYVLYKDYKTIRDWKQLTLTAAMSEYCVSYNSFASIHCWIPFERTPPALFTEQSQTNWYHCKIADHKVHVDAFG